MLINYKGSTYSCSLGDNGTIDTLVYIDGTEHVVSHEIACDYRLKTGGFSIAGFKRLCKWIIAEEM